MNNVASGSITATNVTKVYHLEHVRIDVLRNVNIQVQLGRSVSIMGASGAGKSTLLHTLGGLDKPTGGQVCLNGEDIYCVASRRRNQLRALEFGFVFQSFHLLPELDVLDNVILPALSQRGALARREEIRVRGRELLEQVGLGARMHHRPLEMSGGEQQRASIARALMNHPKYIFADEPTGNLDSNTGGHVLETLFEMVAREGSALIMVTHNQEVAARCQTRFILRDGNLEDLVL
ncbi:MAG TPA: ABC transporter ATP-binding protein [Kiritimatiellia bacterium]|nr:ABC transporter ATP-binding protein [Kiritimatiellia bacterium]